MGEDKGKFPRKLLVRLEWPSHQAMVVELSPAREFLELLSEADAAAGILNEYEMLVSAGGVWW